MKRHAVGAVALAALCALGARSAVRAREVWPEDRYAEDVALRYFTLVQRFE